MSETAEDAFFAFYSLLGDLAIFGGGKAPVFMICLVCYVSRKAKKILFFDVLRNLVGRIRSLY